MSAMGIHSKPIDGTVTANGRELAPFPALQVQRLAPVPNGAERPRTPPNGRERWRPDGDTVIRVLAAAVVLAVAAFAAIVSYSHIFELGRAHGQDGTAARLLPLSVDGLIAAASLVMLHAARRKLGVPQLARWMLALGVGATVAANVEYGMPFGWLAAVVSAWPAVAFVGSVEMAVRFVRDARRDDSRGDATLHVERPTRLAGGKTYCACGRPWPCPHAEAPGVPVVTPHRDSDHDKGDRPRQQVTRKATLKELAAAEGVSVRTLQRRNSNARSKP